MTQFTNATIDKTANVYFDGQVTSRSLVLEDGARITLGIMMPGEYTFGTVAAEKMEISTGQLSVLLPEHDAWQDISGGEFFHVPADSSFKVKVQTITDYCCTYLD